MLMDRYESKYNVKKKTIVIPVPKGNNVATFELEKIKVTCAKPYDERNRKTFERT